MSAQIDFNQGAVGTAVHATSSSGNVANSVATATLAAVPGKTNYCTGFEITGGGATAVGAVIATLAGPVGGTLSYIVCASLGADAPNYPVAVQFSPAIPAPTVNSAITLTVPALGAGNAHSAAVIHGYSI
jgi:hypothetical protein